MSAGVNFCLCSNRDCQLVRCVAESQAVESGFGERRQIAIEHFAKRRIPYFGRIQAVGIAIGAFAHCDTGGIVEFPGQP